MTRSSEPPPLTSKILAGSRSLQNPQRSSHTQPAVSCEAWLQLRRECDPVKCLRRDSSCSGIASPVIGLEDGSRAVLELFSNALIPDSQTHRAGTWSRGSMALGKVCDQQCRRTVLERHLVECVKSERLEAKAGRM